MVWKFLAPTFALREYWQRAFGPELLPYTFAAQPDGRAAWTKTTQNIPFGFAAFSGTSWITSQCSTSLPLLTLKMSMIAWPRSPG